MLCVCAIFIVKDQMKIESRYSKNLSVIIKRSYLESFFKRSLSTNFSEYQAKKSLIFLTHPNMYVCLYVS